jgi:1-aminocyclopropane-1-carboxylate deaminase
MTQEIILENNKEISLHIKREDLLHPIISGNKFRKLKYNLEDAKVKGFKKILTFGGAFSNHILAVAAAGKEYDFQTTGIIRGDELQNKISENPTLKQARELGMHFIFVTREEYRNKEEEVQLEEWGIQTNNFYIIPEGGTNELAIKGCEEILIKEDEIYTHICCSIGTGGTISGIINSASKNQKIIGFSSLKGDFMSSQISNFVKRKNWIVNGAYHFGGYGKVNEELILFLNDFHKKTAIPLDPIYTGKMVFGVLDLIENNYFPKNSKILLIHTGGLQGIRGVNQLLIKKNKEIINYAI